MSWLRQYRVAHALALFALWAQLLWPALAMAGGPDSIAICTGNGLLNVVDPAAPATPAITHDCPCCVVQAQGGMPAPESPALRLPGAGDERSAYDRRKPDRRSGSFPSSTRAIRSCFRC